VARKTVLHQLRGGLERALTLVVPGALGKTFIAFRRN
jgi:hypothetical protein